MKTLNIYYNKLSILIDIIFPYLILPVIYWFATRELHDKFGENWHTSIYDNLLNILNNYPQHNLVIFLLMLIFAFLMTQIILSIPLDTLFRVVKLLNKNPQIVINKYNISSNIDKKSIDWDSIASFEFVHHRYAVVLHLIHRPNGNYTQTVPITILSFNELNFDEKQLSQLLTQLIQTVDENQREILINQFQAA